MKTRRIAAAALAASMVFGLSACGGATGRDGEVITTTEAATTTENMANVDFEEAEVVEIDEDDEETATKLALILDAEEDEANGKFYGEEATLYLNFLGEVERIEFAEIEDKENESKHDSHGG